MSKLWGGGSRQCVFAIPSATFCCCYSCRDFSWCSCAIPLVFHPSSLRCSSSLPGYWGVVLLNVPVLGLLTLLAGRSLTERHTRRVAMGYQYQEGDVQWDSQKVGAAHGAPRCFNLRPTLCLLTYALAPNPTLRSSVNLQLIGPLRACGGGYPLVHCRCGSTPPTSPSVPLPRVCSVWVAG